MFTGIIEETGSVRSFTAGAEAWKLVVSARIVPGGVALGDSVAVNGCCLTVTAFDGEHLHFDILEESRRLAGFDDLRPGSLVNLERSLVVGARMGGHFVTGHVDGTGVISVLESRGRDHYLRVGAPEGSGRLLVHKGSIAIDGISLTLAEVAGDDFTVWLIPHTLAVTSLQTKRVGDKVNLEFDLLGKYVEKLTTHRAP